MATLGSTVDEVLPSFDDGIEIRDSRFANWAVISSFKMSWVFASMYLLAIYYGMNFIQKRGAFNLRHLVFTYDVIMVIFNAYIVMEIFDIALSEKFFFKCDILDFKEHPEAERLVRSLWLFHISKLIECLDTVFFILSGKLRLVTWLHVYHHSTMIPYTWVLAKWIPGSQAFNLVLTNGSVHVVMYTYYALAALGPAWRKYLWWKRYLTILQMIQFVYGIASCVGSVYFDCAYNPSVYYFSIVYIFTILGCFYNHYHQTYRAGRERSQKQMSETCIENSLGDKSTSKGKSE